jgi:hypothetical protein
MGLYISRNKCYGGSNLCRTINTLAWRGDSIHASPSWDFVDPISALPALVGNGESVRYANTFHY